MTVDPQEGVEGVPEAGDDDAENSEALAAAHASRAFDHLLKGLKNISIYRHNESRFPEYVEPAFRELTSFLSEWGNLPLKLGPYNLLYKNRVIYEEQSKENLTYKFYRDGMRFLVFREGLTVQELLRFVLLAITDENEASLQQEDMITRLWKESFQYIEYVVVEGFEFGELSQEEVEVEVEKIVGYLRSQLAANSDDITRFARLSVDDLALELNDIEQVRGGIISGRPAKDNDKEWIQGELYTEEKKRLFAKMTLILFQLLERDCGDADYTVISESFSQILDTLILSEDVRGSVAVLHRFDQIASRPDLGDETRVLVQKVRDNFTRRMAEPQRLQAVGQYMTMARELDKLAVKAYCAVLTPENIPYLLDLLAGMERAEARAILIEILAELGKNHASVFADRLTSNASNVVKDMLGIIDLIDPPDKLDLYAKCLMHPNIMIRLEGLKIMANSTSDVALRHLETATRDQDIQLRLQAYRALAMKHPQRAVPVLKTLMRGEDFTSRDKREQLSVALALGETRTQDALQFFASVFDLKGGFFSRGKENDLKLLAVKGLVNMKNVEAFNVLAAQIQNRGHSKELLEQIRAAAVRLKNELTGQPGQAQ